MRLPNTLLLRAALFASVSLTLSSGLHGQSLPTQDAGLAFNQTAPFEFTVGYSFLHANAPAGMCGCFSMNQGVGTFVYNLPHGLGVAADISGGHTNNISGTPQSISLITFLAGPRYSWRLGSSRYTPYGEVLLGDSSEKSNYALVQNVSGFAFMPGGGVKVRLSSHFGVNVEADWIHSQIANNSNNRQNDIRIATGFTLRFAGR